MGKHLASADTTVTPLDDEAPVVRSLSALGKAENECRTPLRSSAANGGQERAIVTPELIVVLGAPAARSVMGRAVTIGKLRGEALSLDDGTRVVITIHPSALLRMREEAEKRAAYAAFVRDLKIAAKPVFGKARKAASPSLLA